MPNTGDLEARIGGLEARAKKLRKLVKFAPRAFVIEFAGTPKSGKSTASEAIRHFLSRYGFRVHVLSERAAVCPIPMKGHLFFNTWCATSMLAELLENVETETDIIIIDRGLFDSLVWVGSQKRRGELTQDEAKTIESFLLLERWRDIIDLTIVMSVPPEEALAREDKLHFARKRGSIMNTEVLTSLNESVEEAVKLHKKDFKAIVQHKTAGKDLKESNIDLAEKLLDSLELFLDPEVLVVPRIEIERLPLEDGGAFGGSAINDAFDMIAAYKTFMHRAEAERNTKYVQIIPSGLLTHENKVFLFQRKETDPKYRLYGQSTVWQGCHVHKQEGDDIRAILENALQQRIARSLFLSREFPIEALGYCWDREDSGSSQHFGVIFKIAIDNKHTATDLKKKEFRRQRGHGLSGKFDDLLEIKKHQKDLKLESWSQAILEGYVKER